MGGVFEPRNLNLAAYVHQNPLKLVDPDGREPVSIAIAIIVGVAYVGDKAYAGYEGYQDYKAIKAGEKTAGEVIQDRAVEQGAGLAAGPLGRWGVKGLKWAKKLWKGCSFDGSTLVQTKDGQKRIDQISVNELVLAKNLESGEQGWRQVEDRYLNTYSETVTVALKTASGTEDKIVSNQIHPVNVKDKGWTKIGELKAGDQLLTSKGDWATVTSVTVEPKDLTAFNLNVTGFDTFFIGDAGVWVKNCDPIHHVCTNKNCISDARGGPWTPKFQEMFDKAGMSMEDAMNKVAIAGHKGPHPQEYHEAVFSRLNEATKGLSGDAYKKAFRSELESIRKDVATPGNRLNDLAKDPNL